MTASSITSARTCRRPSERGRYGVVAIVACQEFQRVFSARNRVSFEYFKEDRRVGMYYFYILDPQFGPGFINWITQIPTPLGVDDRAVGYWWELSMRQVEVSRTLVLDDPRRARLLFEALVQDNIGIGRPEEVSMVFARQLRRPTQRRYQTRIFTTGTEIRIEFRYKHSRVKQYLKGGRAFRLENGHQHAV